MTPEEIQALPRPIYVVGFHRHADMFGRHHRMPPRDIRVINERQRTYGMPQSVKALLLPGWFRLDDGAEIERELKRRNVSDVHLTEEEAYGIDR